MVTNGIRLENTIYKILLETESIGQARNTGVRRPGYKATLALCVTTKVRDCMEEAFFAAIQVAYKLVYTKPQTA